MNSDDELQAYLDGDPDLDPVVARRWRAVEAGNDGDTEARAALAAYRHVYASLAEPTAGFTPGFIDRVVHRLAAEHISGAEVKPWAERALFVGVILLAVVTVVTFRETLAATWLGTAAPWLALAAAVFGLTEAADRFLLRDRNAYFEA